MPTKFLPISLMVAFFWCFTFNAFSQGGTLPLNGSVNGKIQANATDTWQVTTTSDGLLQFTITSNDPSNYVNAALYDHNGTTVISNVGTSTPGGHVVVSVDGLSAGTYFVKVYAYSPPQNPAYTLSNTFTTAPVANDMEPNNSRTLASLLKLNDSTTGHVGFYYNNLRDTSDWYKVTTTSDGLLRLKITTEPASQSFYLNCTLYDNNGMTVLNSNTTTGNTSTLLYTDGLDAGTYYVKLSQYNTNDYVSYKLADSLFAPPVANDAEPDSTRALALTLPLNGGRTGHLGYYYNNHRDSTDWYKVTTTSDGLLRLYITTLPSTVSDYINCTLYDNNGVIVLNSNTTTGNTNTIINTDGLDAGTYYIKMSQYNVGDYVSYKLADSLFAPPVGNDIEPDSTRALALTLPLNGGMTGHLGYYYNNHRDSTDWYKVTTTTDGLLRLFITTKPSTLSAYLNCTLYDNNGIIVLNSNTTTGNASTIINTDGLDAGTYYIKLSQYNNTDYVSYKLADSLFAPPVANDAEPDSTRALALVLPLNGGMTGHLGYYYNNHRDSTDWYKVTTTSDGLLRLYMTTEPSTVSDYINCTLYDNNGIKVLNSNTTTGNATTILNTDGLAAGTYYVKMSQYGINDYVSYKLADSLFAPPVANDIEPDSTRALALTLPLNGGTTGHLGYFYDNHRDSTDWYKVTIPSDGLLRLNITTEPSTVSDYINCTLYDNNGNTVINSNTTTGAATTFLPTDGLAAGTYYVKMSQYGNNDYVSYKLADSLFTYKYAADTAYEPNGSAIFAKTIPSNSTTTGHFGFYYNNVRDTTDWFKINYTGNTGNLNLTVNYLPHLINGGVDYLNIFVYKDTSAASVYQATFTNTANVVNLTGLTQGYYYVKITEYNNNDFAAYSLTDSFIQGNKAQISLSAIDSSANLCGSDKLTYKLSGSHSPYTVRLYRSGIELDSLITTSNTATFSGLSNGHYYATVFGDGATGTAFSTSVTADLLPPYPTGLYTTNISANAATLNWAGLSCANYFTVQYRLFGTDTWTSINTALDSVVLSGLTFDMVYEWHVAAIDSSNKQILMSAYSVKDTFRTKAALPVTLTNFKGVLVNGDALLSWSTSSESNNKGFELQKSMDSKTFADISFVAGSGNSTLVHNYQYTDDKVMSGSNYYRLKQIDLDGRFVVSPIIKLDFTKFAWAILGNPVANNSWVQVQIDKTSDVIIEVVSLNGSVIQTINKGKITAGTYSIPLNLGQASSGLYVVRLILDGESYSKKIFK